MASKYRARNIMLFALAEGAARLPAPIANALAWLLGTLLFLASPKKRYLTLGNLALAYPESTPGWRRGVARAALRNSIREAFLVMRMTLMPKERLAAMCVNTDELLDALRADLALGKGVVILGAHLGNPTLLAVLASRLAPITGLGTPYSRNRDQQDYIEEKRRLLGLTFVPYNEWPLELLHALRRKEIVTLVTDQRPRRGRRFVWVPYFGVRVRAIPFPAELARLAGAVMRPVYMVREGGRYRAVIREPIPVPTKAQGNEGLIEAATRWHAVLEEEVRPRPEQWMWTLRRWQQSPDGPQVPVLPLPAEPPAV